MTLVDYLPEKTSRAGEANPNAVLNESLVREIIKTRKTTGASAARIAQALKAAYGVTVSAASVQSVISGESWKDVPR